MWGKKWERGRHLGSPSGFNPPRWILTGLPPPPIEQLRDATHGRSPVGKQGFEIVGRTTIAITSSMPGRRQRPLKTMKPWLVLCTKLRNSGCWLFYRCRLAQHGGGLGRPYYDHPSTTGPCGSWIRPVYFNFYFFVFF